MQRVEIRMNVKDDAIMHLGKRIEEKEDDIKRLKAKLDLLSQSEYNLCLQFKQSTRITEETLRMKQK